MPYITKINLADETNETITAVLNWCQFCVGIDKTFSYTYNAETKQLKIESARRDQAFKRGSALHKKYGVFYNVEYVERA